MKSSQESSLYEELGAVDPNLILNVIVPEAVKKQAELWKKGTQSTRYYKPVDKSLQAKMVSDLYVSEDKFDESSGSGDETDDESKATDKIKWQNKSRNDVQLPSTYYLGNPFQDYFQQEPDAFEDPEQIQAGNASRCTTIDSTARWVQSVQPEHIIHRNNRPYEHVKNTRGTPTFSLSVPNRDRLFPTRQPFQGLGNGAGCSPAKSIKRQQTTPPPVVMRRSGPPGSARSGVRAQYRQWVPSTSMTPPSSASGGLNYTTRQPFQGLGNGAGCISAKGLVKRQQTTSPVVMRRSGLTGSARSGVR
ncbi:MAG: hypothetical protein KAG66_01205, partial [Methylococcales bacterium]|nr:hypothetical protein [Methylococcales bacterium]